MRQLASIQEVIALSPIAGADSIEKATVLGWHVVVKKGEYKVGDRVVYVEIDSLLPERSEFEFLRANCYKAPIKNAEGDVVLRGGFRLRTVKLRGQVSQGICFPLSILPEPIQVIAKVGDDVTESLDIVKYEPPEELGGMPRSTFPVGIPKTDETRVQNLGGLLHACRGQTFVMTEKLDGSSFTAFVRGDEFGVCSRNQQLDAADGSHVFTALAARLGLAERMRDRQKEVGDFAIQGEVIGPKIQGNKYALTDYQLRVFDGYWIGDAAHMSHGMMLETARRLGLDTVPVLGSFVLAHSIDEIVAMSEGKSALNPKAEREGIVLRPEEPTTDDRGSRVSFKAISPRFLLKCEA